MLATLLALAMLLPVTDDTIPRDKYGFALGQRFDPTDGNFTKGVDENGNEVFSFVGADNRMVSLVINKADQVVSIVWREKEYAAAIAGEVGRDALDRFGRLMVREDDVSSGDYMLVFSDGRTKLIVNSTPGEIAVSLVDVALTEGQLERRKSDILP